MVALLAVGCNTNTNAPVDFIVKPVKGGEDVQLSKAYKDKPVMCYMWATWCGPCKQIAPMMNKLADTYQGKGIAFLAISPEKLKVIQDSESHDPHMMTVMSDPYNAAADALHATAFPTLVLLDKEHRPIFFSLGYNDHTMDELKAALDTLL